MHYRITPGESGRKDYIIGGFFALEDFLLMHLLLHSFLIVLIISFLAQRGRQRWRLERINADLFLFRHLKIGGDVHINLRRRHCELFVRYLRLFSGGWLGNILERVSI